jgi:altronate dehydratase
MSQRAFIIHAKDNVATALDDLSPGEVQLLGEGERGSVESIEAIPFGHKIALQDLAPGEVVIKSSVVIGQALQAIKRGQHLHLHNVKSNFDERSGTLDKDTGAPTEPDVYL